MHEPARDHRLRSVLAAATAALGLCVLPPPAHALSLEDSLALLDRGASATRRLIVKKFDSGTRVGQGLPGLRSRFQFNPLFSMNASGALRDYDSVRFDESLDLEQAKTILRTLYAYPEVELAYFEPIVTEAIWRKPARLAAAPRDPLDLPPLPLPPPPPNFEAQQFYLRAAPEGVDAYFAWTLPGGTGTGVRVVDVERGWQSDHRDFRPTFWSNGNNLHVEHGTAVWGELAAKPDGSGTTGIAHGIDFGTAGVAWNSLMEDYVQSSPAVYEEAAAQLRAGDILMIEQQATGPDGGEPAPMEYWNANFEVIKHIVDRGIIVVAAAGNGGSDLDSRPYGGTFNRRLRDSGAILVAAGGPPMSFHLERLEFSNYGSRIDAFAYGDGVVSTGYGDLFDSGDGLATYTRNFSGTSSAAPMVVGAIAAIQGVARAQGTSLTPREIRAALQATGSPQRGDRSRAIGNLPDIRALRTYFCQHGRLHCS